MSTQRLSDAQIRRYIRLVGSFFSGQDCDIECRRVTVVAVRQRHRCACALREEDEHQIHIGSPAVREAAKVEGRFGTSYACLPCLDKWGKEIEQ